MRIDCFMIIGLALVFSEASAQSSQPVPPSTQHIAAQRDLTQVSLEDLMNMKVTSVSKEDQKMSQAAAAIFVITQEDISRSGATNIPDLLRMVPGLDVSQINANSWAISSRGFNDQFSNKLLVLIDGRAVYTPLLGGVNWDTQNLPLEDIDRVEVIRGPGATIWGANAVNGVINIVSKKAMETQGVMVSGGGGTEGQAYGTTQYGGTIQGDTSYRVFTNYLNIASLPAFAGASGEDGWHLLHGGFRADSNISAKDSVTIQGDLYTGREGAQIVHIQSIQPPVVKNLDVLTGLSGGNILGRWNHVFSNRSDTTLQFYYDSYERTGPESDEGRGTIDFDFSHHFSWGSSQDVIWGAGYRQSSDDTLGTIDQAFNPANTHLELVTFFAQDTIALRPGRVSLTVGSKVEDTYFTEFDFEPSVRLDWTPSNWMTFWTSISRAARSPTRRDEGLSAGLVVYPDPGGSGTPVETIAFGNPNLVNEHVIAYETGFRTQPNGRISVDVSTFFNHYDHLGTLETGAEFFEPTPAPARFVIPTTFGNLMYGTTEGGELSANLKLTDRWTVSSSYSFLEMHLHTQPSSMDQKSAADEQSSNPQHQAQLRSHVDLSHGLSWDSAAYFVSALPTQGVASYARLDTQLKWKFAEQGEFSLVGQNLLRDTHLESNDYVSVVNSSLIKRSAYAKFLWRFW